MANVLSGNPYVCDSTGVLTTGHITIQAITWTGTQATNRDIAANDDFELLDGSGNWVAGKRAQVAGDDYAITFPLGLRKSGLNLTALDGGICCIYKK